MKYTPSEGVIAEGERQAIDWTKSAQIVYGLRYNQNIDQPETLVSFRSNR